jgi:hypothetical protein
MSDLRSVLKSHKLCSHVSLARFFLCQMTMSFPDVWDYAVHVSLMHTCHNYTNFNYTYNVVSVLRWSSQSHIVKFNSHALLV